MFKHESFSDLRKPLLDVLEEHKPGRITSRLEKYLPKKNIDWISKWKIKPHINPHINRYLNPIKKNIIIPSLDPKSEYVRLYKEALKSLIKEKKDPLSPLSFADCEFIRKSLPEIHVYKYEINGEKYSYDHLFAKYFLKKKKYTPKYSADEIDIFLYLEIYNILKRKTITGLQGFGERVQFIPNDPKAKRNSKNPFYKQFFSRTEKAYLLKESESSSSQFELDHNNTFDFTFDFLIDNIDHSLFMKGGISIYNIMEKLCKDIREILYKDITSLDKANILKVRTNLKVLKIVYNIYKVANFDTFKFTDDLYYVVKDDKDEKFGKKLKLKRTDKNYGMLFIYRIIINSILNYDKDIKLNSLTNKETLEEYWKKYEEKENAIDKGIPLPRITTTLEEMDIKISESNFEINRFFYILIEIYNKIILLYEYEPDKSSSNELKDIFNLSICDDDIDKLAKVEAKVKDTKELRIIGDYSLYLAINLGNNNLLILFSYTNKNDPERDIIDNEESLVFNIPIFNCKDKNENLMEIFRNLNDRGVFILYRKLIELKKYIDTLDIKSQDPLSIYNMYNKMYTSLIQSQGGRKKRIIKSKKNIIKQKRGKKIIT